MTSFPIRQPRHASLSFTIRAFLLLCVFFPSFAFAIVVEMNFPLDVPSQFRDDFGEPRAGHAHKGIDIITPKMSPILSTVDGHVRRMEVPEASWGYEISIQGDDGYSYNYLHINNDTPGTDDGRGGPAYAYAPGLAEGARVTRGQLIGWVGDSGNAETVGSHLHFEMRDQNRALVNPYESLMSALAHSGIPLASSTTVLPSLPKSSYTFTRFLSVGSQNEEVRQLQTLLKTHGYFTHPSITGYFGTVTRTAVSDFQKAHGIDQLGFVGPMTRKALNTL